ncbi:uncharacterized protein LOC131639100 [Vicia villosa]|uniref:uncharacterized protein LOC131639100 n=1 Tax=Vicia villosa TaxID=3911 RepID=UPI00273CAC8F|nr:uncharacterized protein LOC131639100 [Vicia villosa]
MPPSDALEEVEKNREGHMRFHTLQRIYDMKLIAAHQVAGHEAETDIHRERVMRYYFLYLIDTQLFVDTRLTYTNVVYLTYLSDIARICEYNWGAATLAYTYHRLREGCMWKARIVAGSCTLFVGCILHHFPDIIGWGEMSDHTEDMPHARAFAP